MADAAAAVREASGLVAQAIGTLAALGPDAPVNVRSALCCLGEGFIVLGFADPSAPYSVEEPGEAGEME